MYQPRSRFRWLSLLAVLALIFTACGDDDETASPSPSPAEDGGDQAGGGEPEPVPGFDGTTIKVGVLTPTSGPVALIGNPLTNGNRVWFEKVNAAGGIAGKYKIEMVIENSEYSDTIGSQKFDLIKDQVVMFAQVLGTPVTNAVLPKLERENMVGSPASLDIEWVTQQHLLPLGAPYQFQMINGADYYLNEGGGSPDDTFCAFAQSDAYGDAGLEGVEFAAEELGFELGQTTRYARGDTDFTAQAQALADANCDVIFAVATPSEFAGLVKEIKPKGDFRFIGQSPMWINVMPALVGQENVPYLQKNLWVMAEGPEWGDTSVEGMDQMIKDIQQYAPDQQPDYYFGFGYNQGKVVAALLEQAVENGDLSRDGILEAMEQLDEIEFGGLTGTYKYGGVENREPPRSNTIFAVNPDKPNLLEALKVNFTADIAEDYEIPKG